MFSLHTKTQSQHSQIPPALKSVSKKLRFRDGLVWTKGLTVEIKLRFQVSLMLYGQGPKAMRYYDLR